MYNPVSTTDRGYDSSTLAERGQVGYPFADRYLIEQLRFFLSHATRRDDVVSTLPGDPATESSPRQYFDIPEFVEQYLLNRSKSGMVTNAPPVDDKLETALQEAKALRRTVSDLSARVQTLEELVAESHKVILAFSQSYYWTPEWQVKEARADEDLRLGRFKQYDDAEDFIREMNQ